MWKHDYRLGFTEATVFQERNPHNYIRDFESEVPMYLLGEKAYQVANDSTFSSSITSHLHNVYVSLLNEGIVEQKEVDLLESWLKLI